MKIKVLSFNLRVSLDSDHLNKWDLRKDSVFDFVKKNDYDLIGFQEVTPKMYIELKEKLLNYISFGIPRDQIGESCPIFIKKDKFDVLENNTLWLTDTPYEQSKLDGSNFTRIMTFVILKLKNHDQIISYINTHLDYQDEKVIFKQAEYLYKYLSRISDRFKAKIILNGDFNQNPDQMAIKFLNTKLESVYKDVSDYKLTFHGFSNEKEGLPIDYVYYSNDLTLEKFRIIQKQPKDSYLSDHYPLETIFVINKKST